MFPALSGRLAGGVLSALSRPTAAWALAKHLGPCITTSSAAADSHFEPVTVDPLTDDVATFVNETMDVLDMEPGLRKVIINTDRRMSTTLMVPMDNGEVEMFVAHRVQHNNARGPFKGGYKFHPDTTLPEIESLAALNTYKTALINVPFGGGKGGISVDPADLSAHELEKLTRKLVQATKEILGPWTDVPAPDIGTDERNMAWMFDEYSKYKGFSPAVVTGKPLHLHGSLGRDTAAGRGVVFGTRESLKQCLYTKIAGTTFVIQGFGKVGCPTARFLHECGGKVVAVANARSAIYNEKGLDIPALIKHFQAGKLLSEFPGGEALPSNSDFLTLPCDVLVPAALGGVVNADLARKLQCKAVVEAANNPITYAGDAVLNERGIPVLPDIYASGGSLVVSFFEWVQNLQNFRWDEDEINRKLDRYMTDAFMDMHKLASINKATLRQAGYMLSLKRVAQAEHDRGMGG